MDDVTLHLSIPVADLAAARSFYEGAVGCRVGRVRDSWIDVWFYGMQVTLHESPAEILVEQGSRHFGVVLASADDFVAVVERLRAHEVTWLSEPTTHTAAALSGKTGAKIADPSGNVIEIKYYADQTEYRA